MTYKALIVLAAVYHTHAARVRKQVAKVTKASDNNENSGICQTIPNFRTFSPGDKACGASAWGTMHIGLLSARGLADQDGWGGGLSDPYVWLRISDALNENEKMTDQFQSTTKDNLDHPVWKETYAFDFACPQLPFGPTGGESHWGPKPEVPLLGPFLRESLPGASKPGHQFQVELAVYDNDVGFDDKLGRVKIPVLDIFTGQMNGMHSFDLKTDPMSNHSGQGTLDVLLWFCEEGDTTCESSRRAQWAQQAIPDRVVKRSEFDCRMGCHNSVGRLATLVNKAQGELRQAKGHDQTLQSPDPNANKKLARQERAKSWANAIGLTKQLAAIDALGSQLCSPSPVFAAGLRSAANPLTTFARQFNRNLDDYNNAQVDRLLQSLSAMRTNVQGLQQCMRQRWFQEKQLILDQWETTPQCHAFFN